MFANQNFPGDQCRDEALHEMTDLVVVISLESKYRLEVLEEGHFRIGIVPADHQDDAMHEYQEIHERGQPERIVCQREDRKTQNRWRNLQRPRRIVLGIDCGPDEDDEKNADPRYFHGTIVTTSARSVKKTISRRYCSVFIAKMAQFVCILFPVLPVEWLDRHVFRHWIQATHVNVDAVGIRSGNVERFDAAVATEKMPGHSGVERIGRQRFVTLTEMKSGLRNDQMKVAARPANRTVTLLALDVFRCIDIELNRAAVTATVIEHDELSRPPDIHCISATISSTHSRCR